MILPADRHGPLTRVVPLVQQQEGVVAEDVHRHRGPLRREVMSGLHVRCGQCIRHDLHVRREVHRHRHEEMVLLDYLPVENQRVQVAVVEEQVEGTRRKLLRQLTRRALDEGDVNRRIARREAAEDRRQYIRYEEVRATDGEGTMPERREITHITLEAVLRIHDALHRTDVLLPDLGEMNRIRAPIEDRRTDPLLLLFHRRTE